MYQKDRINKKIEHFDNGFEWLGLPLKTILTQWAEHSHLSMVSIDGRLRTLIQFEKWCHKRTIRKPGGNELQGFLDDCKKNGVKPSSIKAYYTQIGCIFRYLYKNDYYPDILKNIDVERFQYRERVCLTSDEVKHLMKCDIPARERAMISLMVFCGLRCVEVSELLYGDINGNRAVIRGKGKIEKSTSIFLPKTVINDIERWKSVSCAPKTSDSPVFTCERYASSHGFVQCSAADVSQEVKKALMIAFPKRPELSAHCLRHTAITLALESGMDFFRVAKFARHSSPTMTMTYTHDNKRFTDPAENRIESLVNTPNVEAKLDEEQIEQSLKRALLKLISE